MNSDNVRTETYKPAELAKWADAVEKEIAALSASIAPLQQQLEAAHEKLDLINRLMHLSADTTPREQKSPDQRKPAPRRPGSPGIEDRIEEVLAAAAEPLHISAIRSTLVEKGVPLPGRGDEANLILRLRRDTSRFVRTGRGFYGLVAWNLPQYAPPHKKKRVRRRKVIAS